MYYCLYNSPVRNAMENNIEKNGCASSKKQTYRIVSCAADGTYVFRDFDGPEEISKRHVQIGVDDCSLDLDIRGLPVFQGLIGPMPEEDKEGKIFRYETPEVFEALTKKLYESSPKRRHSKKS